MASADFPEISFSINCVKMKRQGRDYWQSVINKYKRCMHACIHASKSVSQIDYLNKDRISAQFPKTLPR